MPRWLGFVIFISIFLSIYGGAHLYVYWRVSAMSALRGGWPVWVLRGAFILMALSFLIARLLLEWDLNPLTRGVYWFSSLWMGLFLYLLLLSAASHILTGLLRLFGAWKPTEGALGFGPGRLLLAGVVLASLALSMLAYLEARYRIDTTEIEVPVKGGAGLNGFSIVQISDIHLGVIVDEKRMERIVEKVNALRPDLVVITGDLMDENADRLPSLADSIRDIKSTHGVYMVTGNHDYYAGIDKILQHGPEIGIHFLLNDKATLPNGLVLYGLNDPTAARYGYPLVPFDAVIGPEARTSPAVLLYHQPQHFDEAAALGIDLMLSGHTHKGQIWPLSHISALFYPYQTGLYVNGKSRIYVSRGIGTWGPPMRLDSPPEIVRIHLISN